jgi:hypothetical protein
MAQEGSTNKLLGGPITFDAVQPMLAANCGTCHSAVLTYDGTIQSGWVVPGSGSTSLLYTDLINQRMPPNGPYFSATQAAVVKAWIDAGAPNAAPTPSPTPGSSPTPTSTPSPSPSPSASPTPSPTPSPSSFTSLNNNIFKPQCLGCHNGAGAAAGYDMSSYTAIKTGVNLANPSASSLYTCLNQNMPTSGLLPTAQRQLVLDWITAGAPNN